MIFGLALWLVVILTLEALFLLTCAAHEWPEPAILSAIAVGAVAQLVGGIPVVEFLWAHPQWIAIGFVLYLIAGTGWSVWMWVTSIKKKVNLAVERKAAIYKARDFGTASLQEVASTLRIQHKEAQKAEQGWHQEARTEQDAANLGWPPEHPLQYERLDSSYKIQQDLDTIEDLLTPPQASENKRRIMAWISAWPFSMVWYLIDEPIKQIFEWMKGTYQRISNNMWKSVLEG